MSVHPTSDVGASGFDAVYGLEVTACSEESARGRVQVREELTQVGGLVHGGVYGAIADALAVRGTATGVGPQGKVAIGLATQTVVLHPIARGTIHATATRRHRGSTTWVWEVELADDAGQVCVTGRVTVAVGSPTGEP